MMCPMLPFRAAHPQLRNPPVPMVILDVGDNRLVACCVQGLE